MLMFHHGSWAWVQDSLSFLCLDPHYTAKLALEVLNGTVTFQ